MSYKFSFKDFLFFVIKTVHPLVQKYILPNLAQSYWSVVRGNRFCEGHTPETVRRPYSYDLH